MSGWNPSWHRSGADGGALRKSTGRSTASAVGRVSVRAPFPVGPAAGSAPGRAPFRARPAPAGRAPFRNRRSGPISYPPVDIAGACAGHDIHPPPDFSRSRFLRTFFMSDRGGRNPGPLPRPEMTPPIVRYGAPERHTAGNRRPGRPATPVARVMAQSKKWGWGGGIRFRRVRWSDPRHPARPRRTDGGSQPGTPGTGRVYPAITVASGSLPPVTTPTTGRDGPWSVTVRIRLFRVEEADGLSPHDRNGMPNHGRTHAAERGEQDARHRRIRSSLSRDNTWGVPPWTPAGSSIRETLDDGTASVCPLRSHSPV